MKPFIIARKIVFGLVSLLPLLLAGCFIPSDRDIAAGLEKALREELHPQQVKVKVHRSSIFSTTVRSLDVTLSGFAAESMPLISQETAPAAATPDGAPKPVTVTLEPKKRRTRTIRIVNGAVHCTDFTLKQVPVHAMEIVLREVRVPMQGNHVAIASAGSATASVVFSEDGVNRFLQMRKLPVTDVKVRLTRDGCVVNGRLTSFLNAPVELSGRIRAREPALLYMEDPKVRVTSLALPSLISDQLLKNLNPLADLNTDFDFPVPVTITSAEHEDRHITFKGILHFPKPVKR